MFDLEYVIFATTCTFGLCVSIFLENIRVKKMIKEMKKDVKNVKKKLAKLKK